MAILKVFWPYIVGALALLAVWGWHKSEIREARADERRIVEEAQAEVIAKRMYENEKREHAMALEIVKLQNQLKVNNDETQRIGAELGRVAAASRLCLADKVRSRSVPEDPRPAGPSDGAAPGNGLPDTVGGTVTWLLTQCELNTNKLMTIQPWVSELKAKGF